MKKNEGTNDTDVMVRLGQFKSGEGEFVRRGKEGGWREYIEEGSQMMKTLEEWKDKNVKELQGRLPPLEKIWPKLKTDSDSAVMGMHVRLIRLVSRHTFGVIPTAFICFPKFPFPSARAHPPASVGRRPSKAPRPQVQSGADPGSGDHDSPSVGRRRAAKERA